MQRPALSALLLLWLGCNPPTQPSGCGETLRLTGRPGQTCTLRVAGNYFAALECAAAHNKPLFVYFTCHGCMGYEEFRYDLIQDDTLRNLLNQHFVCVFLPTDDRQRLDSVPEQQLHRAGVPDSTIRYIREKNTTGALNSSLQVTLFGSASQPFYVLMNHSGAPLVQPFGYTGKNAAFFAEQLRSALEQ